MKLFGNLPREILQIVFEYTDPNTTHIDTQLELLKRNLTITEEEWYYCILKNINYPRMNRLIAFLPYWFKKEKQLIDKHMMPSNLRVYYVECIISMGIFTPFFQPYQKLSPEYVTLSMMLAGFPYDNLSWNINYGFRANIYASKQTTHAQPIIKDLDSSLRISYQYKTHGKNGVSQADKTKYLQIQNNYPYFHTLKPPNNYLPYDKKKEWIYMNYPNLHHPQPKILKF